MCHPRETMRKKHIAEKKLYFLMNKAPGTVCSTVSDSHKTVYETFPEEILISPEGAKLHTVGRLDCDTEGLLLFTNDGKLSNFLTRPESKIQKTYLAELEFPVSRQNKQEYARRSKAGLVLPAEKKFPEQKSGGAEIQWLSDKKCTITLTEGKFHEVKRIFLALGNRVLFLKRIKMAGLSLDENLPSGAWRSLTEEEIFALKSQQPDFVPFGL